LESEDVTLLQHYDGVAETNGFASSGHLMLVRLNGRTRTFRDALIVHLAEAGVSSNVHYKPLPLLTAYKNMGFDISNYPNALAQFENEITLPLHTLLSDEDVDFIVEQFARCKAQLEAEGLE
jgi:dTDP-4-amino-4,6-dideoxygalactose transaminase